MSEERATKADAIASSLQPLAETELARVDSEKDQPRVALSVAANLAGGESLLWIGRPSERVIRGYWTFAAACMIASTPLLYLAIERGRGPLTIAGILLAMAVPPIWAAWKQALVRHTTYELTTERLRVTHGILSLEVDDVELYRIKDIHVRQPLLQRICSLGSIVIWSSDVTLPRCRIHAQPIGVVRELREQIRLLSEDLRDRKVVRNST
jgi:membrane protein YdbS with pleckstrin-like domain